jgi:uncharacterized membrane protein YphA (DoxX/SURF4 family)
MNIFLWVVQGLLAVLFLTSGASKLLRSKEQLSAQMHWVEDFPPAVIKLIGLVEVLGAVGLILPALTGILPWLTPLAAVGLALDMIGASLEHIRRGEYSMVGMTAILLVLAAFAAYGRFVVMPL